MSEVKSFTIKDYNQFIYLTKIDRKVVSSFLIKKDKIVKIDFDTNLDLASENSIKYVINIYIEPYTNCLSIHFIDEKERDEYKDIILDILSK